MKKTAVFVGCCITLSIGYFIYFTTDFSRSSIPQIKHTTQEPLHIILDLNGLLINTDSKAQRNLIGTWNIIAYMFKDVYRFQINHPRDLYFNFLNNLKPHNPDEILATDQDGTPLPQYKCDWLKGTISGATILDHIEQALVTSTLPTSAKTLIGNTARATFIPELFIQTRILDRKGFNFVQECRNAGYTLYIMTNWDPESCALLEKKYPELFALFDGIVVSGNVGLIKPDPRIYTHFLQQFNLNPSDCVFVDDMENNVISAQNVGMHGIICPQKKFLWKHSPDFGAVKDALARLA
jgi:epoxide hydrolase-like predicted phosphatase